MLGLTPNIISWLMLMVVTVTSVLAFAPQVVKLLKTKRSKDISILSWIVWLGQYTIMTLYAVVFTTDIVLCAAYFMEWACCLLVLVLAVRYRRAE